LMHVVRKIKTTPGLQFHIDVLVSMNYQGLSHLYPKLNLRYCTPLAAHKSHMTISRPYSSVAIIKIACQLLLILPIRIWIDARVEQISFRESQYLRYMMSLSGYHCMRMAEISSTTFSIVIQHELRAFLRKLQLLVIDFRNKSQAGVLTLPLRRLSWLMQIFHRTDRIMVIVCLTSWLMSQYSYSLCLFITKEGHITSVSFGYQTIVFVQWHHNELVQYIHLSCIPVGVL